MIMLRLLLSVCLLLCPGHVLAKDSSPGATDPSQGCLIGLLKKPDNPNDGLFSHGIYFECEGRKIKGLHVSELDSFLPRESTPDKTGKSQQVKMFVTSDGKSIGQLSVKRNFGFMNLGRNLAQIKSKMEWMKTNRRPHALVTTSSPKFSDPEFWKRFPVGSSSLKEDEIQSQISDLKNGCVTDLENKSTSSKVNSFEIEAIYRPRSLNRALVKIANPKCIRWDSIAESKHYDSPHAIWLFKKSSGEWKRKFAVELIDIGDFDRSGKSKALFYQADETTSPQGIASIWDLEDFEPIATATDSGY